MKIRVCDSETTGLETDENARLVELAWCDVDIDTLAVTPPRSTFVNPCLPIPAVASAVHHIVDAMVVGAPVPAGALALLHDGMEPGDIYAAHNKRFDQHFIPTPEGFPWICTYKAAKRMIPSAPTHSNQGLRYWLNLEVDPELAMPPHRAGADVHVTACILVRMLRKVTVEDLVGWAEQPVHLPTLEFGNKHRGSRWADVPTDYLSWMVNDAEKVNPDVLEVARMHLKDRLGK
jgi:exodeoxyribonuclease X